jgi:hypothetical protein
MSKFLHRISGDSASAGSARGHNRQSFWHFRGLKALWKAQSPKIRTEKAFENLSHRQKPIASQHGIAAMQRRLPFKCGRQSPLSREGQKDGDAEGRAEAWPTVHHA